MKKFGALSEMGYNEKEKHKEEFIREMVMNVAKSGKETPYGWGNDSVKWIRKLYDKIYVI